MDLNHEARRRMRAIERRTPALERKRRIENAAWEDKVIHRRAQERKQEKAHERAVLRRKNAKARVEGVLQAHRKTA